MFNEKVSAPYSVLSEHFDPLLLVFIIILEHRTSNIHQMFQKLP